MIMLFFYICYNYYFYFGRWVYQRNDGLWILLYTYFSISWTL